MLTPELYFQHYQQLPPLAQKVLVNKQLQASLSDIVRHNDLTEDQRRQTVLLTGDASVGGFPVAQLPAKLLSEAKLDEQKGKKVAVELLGRFFLPLQWHLGNVEGLIKKLGGDVAKYEAEARKNYPEVYAPHVETEQQPTAPVTEVAATAVAKPEPEILHFLNDRLATQRGRAEVLLRLTNLSGQVEDAIKAKKMPEDEGQALYKRLDALSFAINTQDLNPLEVAAITRQLKTVLAKLGQV